MLRAHDISAIADVRRFPASRRYPHFNRETFSERLAEAGIDYHWFPELGGRRKAHPDSHNTRWRNESFRGYADYMETKEFQIGMERLLAIAAERRVAIMCSEAVWWRCHRSLISDFLTARGIAVMHIMGEGKAEPHRYTEPARVINGVLSYAEDRLI